MAALNLGTGLGLVISVVLVVFIGLQFFRGPSYSSPPLRGYTGSAAQLPCLANNQCPMGQSCSGGFCSEGFMAPVSVPTNDMSSCGAKECDGINAPCGRTATPCAEGTFCQKNQCVSIMPSDEGSAYNQIGMILN
jgi:hypothetical protein